MEAERNREAFQREHPEESMLECGESREATSSDTDAVPLSSNAADCALNGSIKINISGFVRECSSVIRGGPNMDQYFSALLPHRFIPPIPNICSEAQACRRNNWFVIQNWIHACRWIAEALSASTTS